MTRPGRSSITGTEAGFAGEKQAQSALDPAMLDIAPGILYDAVYSSHPGG